MGTYPPRACGIATFNQDLFRSSQIFLGNGIDCTVCAVNLLPMTPPEYPREVSWTIEQNAAREYRAFAKTCNKNPLITGIIIQHEYGIYGGEDGKHILSFMEACVKPIVVTIHTVLPTPSAHMKSVTERVLVRAQIVVVLTQNSKFVLERLYPSVLGKVHVIPHGVHDTPFEDTLKAKKMRGYEGKTVLSTFGLLSRGKGIEYVLRALPALIDDYPTIHYLVLGETHPNVKSQEGETYRTELEQLVCSLKLTNHVTFYNKYLSLTDLIGFLKATDIYISTSINPNQAVSGTLSYALGTGRAAISTAFSQAKEIITLQNGRLVPFMDAEAYTKALRELLMDPTNLSNLHKSAYLATRQMVWNCVAQEYSMLLKQNILPPVNLEHLHDMTDDYGMFQFAKHRVPHKAFGYTLDDNARALVACCWLPSSREVTALRKTYIRFIASCQLPDGRFANYMSHNKKSATDQNREEDLEDATARAVWALGEVMASDASQRLKDEAQAIFDKALPHTKSLKHLRSSASVIKAFALVIKSYPQYRIQLTKSIHTHARRLVDEYKRQAVPSWRWFNDYLAYNNGIIPEALCIAGAVTETPLYTKTGQAALSFLIEKTFSPHRYIPIGHAHWYQKNGERSHFDQQPEDPASMILALVTALQVTHDETYRHLIDVCFSWFLGNNALMLPLYNYKNGGCYDGLHPDRVNLNQGAESTVSYLLARLSIEKIYNHENSRNQKSLY